MGGQQSVFVKYQMSYKHIFIETSHIRHWAKNLCAKLTNKYRFSKHGILKKQHKMEVKVQSF